MLHDLWQKFGLAVINGLARSATYERRELDYASGPRNKMDWYRLARDACRPTIVFYYGGNWQSGRKEEYRFVADTLLSFGYDVVIPDYRLYPEVRFGAILDDARRAANTVQERLPNDTPVFLMGHSAGAQIAALLTLNEKLLDDRSRIRGFIGLAGPYDFFPFTEDAHWDLFAPEAAYPESQAVNYVRADAPPLYLLHGENDRRVRRGHSKSLMEKQLAVGGTASREVYPGMGHIDIILAFSRLHRRKCHVARDVNRFIEKALVNAATADSRTRIDPCASC